MKNSIKLLLLLSNVLLYAESSDLTTETPQAFITLSAQEINAIRSTKEQYVYFGPEMCSLIRDLSTITIEPHSPFDKTDLYELCDLVIQGKKIAPFELVESVIYQAAEYCSKDRPFNESNDGASLLEKLESYYQHLKAGDYTINIFPDNNGDIIKRCKKCTLFRALKTCDITTNDLTVTNNASIGGDITIDGNEVIEGNLVVFGDFNATIEPDFISPFEIIGTPEQSCILFEDSTTTEKARICSSPLGGDKGVFVSVDNGTTQNLRINNAGGMVIAPPSSGVALSATGNTGAGAIVATGNGTTIAPALTLIGNPSSLVTDDFLTIDTAGVVRQSSLSPDNIIANNCQPGPITIGTSDATSLTLATNVCTPRLTTDSAGAIVILTPTTGEALTVNGNVVVPLANAAETEGIVKLGGTTATDNVKMYEFATRNIFVGNGTINSTVSGTDNISIGSNANSSLTTSNNTIALGNNAQITGSDSIAIGNAATTTAARTIVVGSTDSTSTGAAPTATAINAIAIGSASSTNAGAVAGGTSTIAIGGADGATFAGATAAVAMRSVAIGVAAISQSDASILIGSASGTAGGVGPNTLERAAICIGSAVNAFRGANSFNISTIAIGSSDGTLIGPAARGTRSIAIGLNALMTANTATGAIVLGSGSDAAAAGPTATGAITGGVVIGSGQAAFAGASTTGAGSVALGGSSGSSAGASVTAARAVAVGPGATATASDNITLGNVAATAVRVGIGIAAPAAKLDIVGVNGTPVMRFNQVAVAAGNAPRWLNRATSAASGTPIHYNASNQLFGFTSSKRYKTNIRPLESHSNILYALHPVLYDAKEGHGHGHGIAGFIAEEVYEVAPHLVVTNSDGHPENVTYNALHALAIKEIQNHQASLINNATTIEHRTMLLNALKQTTETLKLRLNNYLVKNLFSEFKKLLQPYKKERSIQLIDYVLDFYHLMSNAEKCMKK